MKLQSIFVFVILILANFGTGERLTPEENLKRIENCGKFQLRNKVHPSNSSTPLPIAPDLWPIWISLASGYSRNSKNFAGTSLATMISSRHFLTSSQVVLNDNYTWKLNTNHSIDVKEACAEKNRHFKLYKSIVKSIKLGHRCFKNGSPGCSNTTIEPVEAWLLNFCDMDQQFFKFTQIPMVVEVNQDYSNEWMCLRDDFKTAQKMSKTDLTEVFTYGKAREMKHRRLNLFGSSGDYLFANHFEEGERGGPIIQNVDGRWILRGLEATAGQKKTPTLAHRLSVFQQGLCETVGICAPMFLTTTTTTKPTTVPSTTTTTTKATTPTTTTKPTPPPVPSTTTTTTEATTPTTTTTTTTTTKPTTVLTTTTTTTKATTTTGAITLPPTVPSTTTTKATTTESPTSTVPPRPTITAKPSAKLGPPQKPYTTVTPKVTIPYIQTHPDAPDYQDPSVEHQQSAEYEYEEFQRLQEMRLAQLPDEDVDDDIYVSRDFLTDLKRAGSRFELFLIVLVVIVFVQ
ncbi:hypothetical protein B9Z55_003016 [Caenorhabditis nigoni]|uniref:Peptidase S1 domain-containing protein n=1 Tax=Caenorhabditis nigoni TaxID=1611254 RepID=A0A2G5VNL0_9PELO|nr:hypothetical protein B9Z55_003016 [Caenorhabditis nigoni]